VAQHSDDLAAAIDILSTLDEIDSDRVGIISLSSGAACAVATPAGDTRICALVPCSATLAGPDAALPRVTTPTVLVVGQAEASIQTRNEILLESLGAPRRLEPLPSDLFEDPRAIARASDLMAECFGGHVA
jgi:dienelactone hydrolase